MDFLDKLSLAGLVPVIAINDAEDAVPLCKALSGGDHLPDCCGRGIDQTGA